MLIAGDFAYQVTSSPINGVPCWKYGGNDLDECIAFAQLVRQHGERFYDPLTQEVTGVHRATLDREMVRLLAAMSHYQEFND
jgi:hypothetical protein